MDSNSKGEMINDNDIILYYYSIKLRGYELAWVPVGNIAQSLHTLCF